MQKRQFLKKSIKILAGVNLLNMLGRPGISRLLAIEQPTGSQMIESSLKAVKPLLIEGQVVANGQNIDTTAELGDKNTIQTSANSFIVLSLKDGSLIRIYENSHVALAHNEDKMVIVLIKGAVRFASNNNYKGFYPNILHTQHADYVIKNAVFFCQTLVKNEFFILENGKTYYPPPLAKEYACICKGAVDFLTKDLSRVFQNITATYHNSFFVIEEGKYLPATIINHDAGFNLLK